MLAPDQREDHGSRVVAGTGVPTKRFVFRGVRRPQSALRAAVCYRCITGVPFGRPGNDRMSQQPEVSTIPPSPVVSPTSGQAAGQIAGPVSGQAQASNLDGSGLDGFGPNGTSPNIKQGVSEGPRRIPPWLERAELFLRVLLRMYIGIAVCYAPWSRLFWDQNPLFLQFPSVGVFVAHGAVRGLVSGLGLLNLWIAFRDAIRQREE